MRNVLRVAYLAHHVLVEPASFHLTPAAKIVVGNVMLKWLPCVILSLTHGADPSKEQLAILRGRLDRLPFHLQPPASAR